MPLKDYENSGSPPQDLRREQIVTEGLDRILQQLTDLRVPGDSSEDSVGAPIQQERTDLEFIIKVSRRKVARLNKTMNFKTPFYRLPLEISGEVLQLATSDAINYRQGYTNLFSVRTVSFHMFDIIGSSPHLWDKVSTSLHPELVTLALRSSRARPLTVEVAKSHPKSSLEVFLAQITPHSHRWQHLFADAARWEDWGGLLSDLLPPLKTLMVRGSKGTSSSSPTIHQFPPTSQPHLLTRLHLSPGIAVEVGVLAEFLSRAPGLEKLEIRFATITTIVKNPPSPVTLPRLRWFEIQTADIHMIPGLLDLVSAPPSATTIVSVSKVYFGEALTEIIQAVHARIDLHSRETIRDMSVTLGDKLFVQWFRGRGSVELELRVFPSDKRSIQRAVLGHCNELVSLWLKTKDAEDLPAFLGQLGRSCPNLQVLRCLNPWIQVSTGILRCLAEKREDSSSNEWILPNLTSVQFRETKKEETFDEVVTLVEARASDQSVKSITYVELKNGSISQSALVRLKELVDRVVEINVRVVQSEAQ